ERALAAAQLVRATAAALPRDRAMDLLRRRLTQVPSDAATLRTLLSRIDPARPDDLLLQWIRLIDAAPMNEALYAEAMLGREQSAKSLLTAWERLEPSRVRGTAGRLLHARLLAAAGSLEDAQQELGQLLTDQPECTPAA